MIHWKFALRHTVLLVLLLFTTLSSLKAATAALAAGQNVNMTAYSEGKAPFSYQWYKDNVLVAGATSATYLIPSFQTSDAGIYHVAISNALGSTVSEIMALSLSTGSAPVFNSQPQSQTVTVGAAVTFSTAASGAPMPTYQWRKNGMNVSGATSATFTIAGATSGDAGTYAVVATNSAGTAISNSATLTVSSANTAPLITTQPLSQTVVTGATVTFNAAASGSPAPTYQWRKNGVTISGATNSFYSIASTSSGDAGTYTVVATNSAGTATSVGATLAVGSGGSTAPLISTQPQGRTVMEGTAVTFTVVATGSPAPSYQWMRNGGAISGATGTSYAIASASSTNAGTYTVVVSNSAGSVTSSNATLTVNSVPAFTLQPTSQAVIAGSAVSFTVAASGSPTPTYQWRKNGTNISGVTGVSYTIASATSTDAASYTVVATNYTGSATSTVATLTVSTTSAAPVITTQPQNQTILVGAAATLTVVASGSPSPTYQWRKNGTNISGATSSSYAIANVSSSNAGTYSVVVANSVGSVTSSNATLTVNSLPVFTLHPANKAVTAGSSVTFTAAASGTPTPTYQWRKNGTNISGATGASYTIAIAASGDAGTYSVVATNSVGTATSNGADLTVNSGSAAPVITTQPQGRTVLVGAAVTFTVVASGSPSPTYQWRRNGTNISGAANSSYSIASASSTNAGTYTVVVSNSVGSVTSSNATLTVNSLPVFTLHPANKTVTAGSPVTFTAAASGSPTPTYQWRKNGKGISGATGASYTIASTVVTDAASYTVVATNSAGSATSYDATLTVNTALPAIDAHPSSQRVLSSSRVTFSVQASSNEPLTYQWRKDGQNISNTNSPAYTVAKAQSRHAGSYSVVVTSSGGSVTSDPAILSIRSNAPSLALNVDFNADGQADILLQNNVTGGRSIWLMAGASVGSTASLTQMSTDWEIAGAGDFNQDGKSDIVWQNFATGECRVWLMNGTSIASTRTVGTVTPDWELVGAGRFNADGYSDLLWQNSSTGERIIWLLNGTALNTTVSLGVISLDWELVGTGDFNADGGSDLLLQNRVTAECGVWLMNLTTLGNWVSLGQAAAGCLLAGSADLNGDDRSDLLWQNPATGQRSVWFMNGTAPQGTRIIGTLAGEWSLQN